jgi:hypothetical protein
VRLREIVCQRNRRDSDLIAIIQGVFNRLTCDGRKSGIVEQIPYRGVGIRDGYDHAISSRPNVENISARFWSISSSDGAGPYWLQIPSSASAP